MFKSPKLKLAGSAAKICNEMCKICNFSLACFIDFYKTFKVEITKSMNSMK